MNEETYAETQTQIVLLAQLVRDLPLAEFITAARYSYDTGPIVDPSLWLKGSKQLANIIHLAETLRKFQVEARQQMAEAQERVTP
jgi:hypothetical protein